MSRQQHASSSSSRHRRPTEDDDEPRSSSEYKELYKAARYDLKRKRRELDELDEKLDREERDTKKAKQDTKDLWKIYYTLQQELQQSYERNAKLQAEKAQLDAQMADQRKKADERVSELDSGKMKEALMNMQKEKMDMQQRFNDIVLENKKLREKELTYEPRLQEMEQLRQRVVAAQQSLAEVVTGVGDVRAAVDQAAASREQLERHQRWNSLLMIESQQKGTRLRALAPAESRIAALAADKDALAGRLRQAADGWLAARDGLRAVAADARQLRMEVGWSGESVERLLIKLRSILCDDTSRKLVGNPQAPNMQSQTCGSLPCEADPKLLNSIG